MTATHTGVLLTFLALAVSIVSSEFNINTVTDGNFSIGVNNQIWLHSGPFYVNANGKRYSTGDGTLKMKNYATSSSGIDRLGPWQDTNWFFYVRDLVFKGRMKTYQTDQLPLIIFSQHYYNDTSGTSSSDSNTTINSFPSFYVRDLKGKVGYLSFGGDMLGDAIKNMGIWGPQSIDINGGLEGGPLVLFDQLGNTVILQAFSNFMAVSLWYDNTTQTINCGIMGKVNSIPAGFEYSVVLYYGSNGINKAFEDLGSRMRWWYGKSDYYKKLDLTLNYLGYWTDNGAYYYYNTENGNTTSYEQTLLDVKAYSDQMNIPYKYMQLDSWWYSKGQYEGVITWTPMANIFPHGLRTLHANLSLPLTAQSKFWSRNTTYAKQNGGKYKFIVGKHISLPDDQSFWNDLFANAKKWGLVMYEQTWMSVQMFGMEALQNDLTLGQRWLEQMGNASDKNGIPIQYTMAFPRHALQSLTIQTVTQARVGFDYNAIPNTWKIGITSIFANSLGLSPSKDTFWTITSQPGNPNELNCHRKRTPGDMAFCGNATEPHPALQTLVAVLSTGPVGPGDMINGTNRDILMRCCNDDGLILKPSKPATAIDDQIIQRVFFDASGPMGELWTTYTDFDDVHLRFGIIFAADTYSPYIITRRRGGLIPPMDLYPNKIFLANDTTTLTAFDDQHPFTIPACRLNNNPSGCVYYTSPVLKIGSTEVVILGDLNKYVPMSPQRVYKIWVTDDTVAMTLRGKQGETITTTVSLNGRISQITKTAKSSGCANFLIHKEAGSSFKFPTGMQCSWQMTTTAAPATPSMTTSTRRQPTKSTPRTTRPIATTTKKNSSIRNTSFLSLIIAMTTLRYI